MVCAESYAKSYAGGVTRAVYAKPYAGSVRKALRSGSDDDETGQAPRREVREIIRFSQSLSISLTSLRPGRPKTGDVCLLGQSEVREI